MRNRLIAIVTFLSGLYFVLDFVLPQKIGSFEFGLYSEQVLHGVTIVGSMAFGLGLINIFLVHGSRLVKGQRGWSNSLALLLGMALMFGVQILDFRNSEQDVQAWKPFSDYAVYTEKIQSDYPSANAIAEEKAALLKRATAERVQALRELRNQAAVPDTERTKRLAQALDAALENASVTVTAVHQAYRGEADVKSATTDAAGALRQLAGAASEYLEVVDEVRPVKKLHRLLYEGFFVPLGAAMFSLLAFYIANAAYRSFRVRSVEASVMMLAAIVVILGQIPHGPLYISEHLPAVRLWLLKYINTPGNRAIYFGAAIAGFAMAIRMWLSLERSPLADDDAPPSASGGK